jgi:hypothetical protein
MYLAWGCGSLPTVSKRPDTVTTTMAGILCCFSRLARALPGWAGSAYECQTRVVNASLFDNLNLTSPVSRVITQKVPVSDKAHWANPKFDFANDLARLSADLRGSTRHIIKGNNLTMEGGIHAGCPLRAASLTITPRPAQFRHTGRQHPATLHSTPVGCLRRSCPRHLIKAPHRPATSTFRQRTSAAVSTLP